MDDEDHTLENQESSYSKSNKNSCSTKEHDRVLPIANVGRIMKKVIPGNGKISKEAKETVQEYVSEFISFVTGEASDKCQREKRKTINGDDIIWAITILGFEDYVNPLKIYLNRFRELEGDKLNNVPKQQHQQQIQQQQQQQQPQQQQLAIPSQIPLQQLLHHHREQQRQQQYDQFLQIDQGLLPLEAATTVCSSNSTTNNSNNNASNNVNQQASFQDVVEQNPFSYPSFSSSSSSIQKDFQHQEQIDSMLGRW